MKVMIIAETPLNGFIHKRMYRVVSIEAANRRISRAIREWHEMNCKVVVFVNGVVFHKD